MKEQDVIHKNVIAEGHHELDERFDFLHGQQFDEELLRYSCDKYLEQHDSKDANLRTGLFGQELEKALQDPRTLIVGSYDEDGDFYIQPAIVPADLLVWKNTELLNKTFGEEAKYYYWAAPILVNEDQSTLLKNAIVELLDQGAVILYDSVITYSDDHERERYDELLSQVSQDEYAYRLLDLGELENGDRYVDVFEAPVAFGDSSVLKEASSIGEIYASILKNSSESIDVNNSVALEKVINGEEAEKIWEIYDRPFEQLGEQHPEHAGFEKEELLEILEDENIEKIVNRVNGEITTLCFFVNDFKYCEWFNEDYYSKKYPDYYDSKNILIFPGIVSDESKRGNNYSLDVIDLAIELFSKRGSSVLVTFECTETSAQYVPLIVKSAIENSGKAKVGNIESPQSRIRYKALVKSIN